MKSILKIIKSKPSNALQAMVDGLLEQDARKDFTVDMNTYGYYDYRNKTCRGCAATCALQKLANVNLTDEDSMEYKVITLGFVDDELYRFEIAIDAVRRGSLDSLFEFCHYPSVNIPKVSWVLRGSDWRGRLDDVRETITQLREMGY